MDRNRKIGFVFAVLVSSHIAAQTESVDTVPTPQTQRVTTGYLSKTEIPDSVQFLPPAPAPDSLAQAADALIYRGAHGAKRSATSPA